MLKKYIKEIEQILDQMEADEGYEHMLTTLSLPKKVTDKQAEKDFYAIVDIRLRLKCISGNVNTAMRF